MNNTIINVIIGVVSSTLFALLVCLFKNHLRRLWFSTLGIKDLYNKLGVVKIFQRRSDAITFLFPNLLKSKYIKVFQFKGYSLLDSYNRIDTTLYKLASHPDSNIKKVSFLLLNPKNEKYISQRINELYIEDSPSNYMSNKEDIERSVQIIKSINESHHDLKCEYAFFNESLKWNLLISDNYTLISFYLNRSTANSSVSLIVRNDKILGYSFNKYFLDVWENRSVKNNDSTNNLRGEK